MKQNMKEAIGLSLKRYNDTYMKAANDRIDNIVSQAGTDNTEIVDARIDSAGVTHTTLNNRILAETKMNDEQLVEYTGSNISAEDTTQGYLKDVEILGNTIQNEEDLADIKSVGVLQEDGTYKMSILSCGKNLFNGEYFDGYINDTSGVGVVGNNNLYSNFIKVTPNTDYVISYNITKTTVIAEYSSDKQFIKRDIKSQKFRTGEHTYYIRFQNNFTSIDKPIFTQFEEGTVATSYEPYQGNKCDILLSCQLEKVGDVSDRLYYDDVEKAWCIEKNVETIKLNGTEQGWYLGEGGRFFEVPINDIQIPNKPIICDKYKHMVASTGDETGKIATVQHKAIRIHPLDMTGLTLEVFKKQLSQDNVLVKYPTTEPQKIVLPLSTQITLNSFFGTTHVYMESGEVEGTIKCKIPKSLGATVQSLNNKTDILSDRIEAIEGLKDSQNMKYETDKGYLVCKETKNGVIDDLKIEGKTLVNLCPKYVKNSDLWVNKTFESDSDGFVTVNANGTWVACPRLKMSSTNIKPNTTYTVILEVKSNTLVSSDNNGLEFSSTSFSEFAFKWNKVIKPKETGTFVHRITSLTNLEGVWELFRTQIYNTCTEGSIVYRWHLLEGDHTQNPPSYFEGLMSVGQDVDKISVESVKGDGNLISSECKVGTLFEVYAPKGEYVASCKSKQCTIRFYRKDKTLIDYWSLSGEGTIYRSFVTQEDIYYVLFDGDINTTDIQLIKGTTPKPYTQHQSDKKQILFYNENGELEPIQELHEWDSIEKHSDNKWYYHKRSGKVVLNGSEEWEDFDENSFVNRQFFKDAIGNTTDTDTNKAICNRFVFGKVLVDTNRWQYYNHLQNVWSMFAKKTGQTLEQFKSELQSNNVTVVYQLAQEEVYELAPLHLDSYANETLILCNSGAISPKMEFSITSHINELVKAYGERVNLLEEKVYQYMVTQNRMQLASTYSADSVTFKVDYFSLCGDEENYDEDLYNLILNNILVGKDNYNYDKMFTIILDYASWNQISWEQFDILVGLMDMQHNPPVEELPTEDEIEEDIIEEETPVE